MVKYIGRHEEEDFYLFPRKRSPIGHYSGEKRDFEWELQQKEPDKDNPEEWLTPEKRNSPEFIEETESLWKSWTEQEGGLDPHEVNVYWTGQSHLDMAWEWRLGQTVEKARVTYGKAVFHGERVEGYIFAASQPLSLEFVRQRDPSLFSRILEQVRRGSFELVGGLWTEIDARMPSGESFIRNRLYGQLYYLKYFGKISEVEWLPDTFGYAYSFPQIIRKSGGRYFFTTKVWGHMKAYPDAPWPFTNFWWEGPDGSRVLSHIQPQMFGPLREWPVTRKLSRLVKEGKTLIANYEVDHPESHKDLSDDKNDTVNDLGVFFGWGDGGHGPTGKELAQQWYFMEKKGVGKWSTVHDYFRLLEERYGDRLPIWSDELYFQAHQGTLTTQGLVKRANRLLEWRIVGLESLYTLTEMMGILSLPFSSFRQLWKMILTNQFHDILPGSSIAEVYDDTWDFYMECFEELNKWEEQFLQGMFKYCSSILSSIKDDYVSFFIVANPLGMKRKDIISIPVSEELGKKVKSVLLFDGEKLQQYSVQFVKGDLSAFGVDEPLMAREDRVEFLAPLDAFEVSYGFLSTLENAPKDKDGLGSDSEQGIREDLLKVSETEQEIHVENRYLSFSVEKASGEVKDVLWYEDGQCEGRRLFNGPSFVLRAYGDFEGGDAWEISPSFRENPMDWEVVEPAHVVEEGPLRVVVEYRVRVEEEESIYIHRLIVYRNLPEIHSELLVNLKDPYFLIKIQYPVATDSKYSVAEIPAAVIKRRTERKASHDRPRWEVFHHTFVDMPSPDDRWGIVFVNNGKYGYSVENGVFELTLLRKPRYPKIADEAWVLKKRRERIEAGEYIPTTTDEHWHVIHHFIRPHKGDWKDASLNSIAHAFNLPVIAKSYSLSSVSGVSENKQGDGGTENNVVNENVDASLQAPLKNSVNLLVRDSIDWKSPIEVSPSCLEIMALKAWEPTSLKYFRESLIVKEDLSGGYILRVVNFSDAACEGMIHFHSDLSISQVEEVNLLEFPLTWKGSALSLNYKDGVKVLETDGSKDAKHPGFTFDKKQGLLKDRWKPFEIKTYLLL